MNCDSAAISMVHGMFGQGISDPQIEFRMCYKRKILTLLSPVFSSIFMTATKHPWIIFFLKIPCAAMRTTTSLCLRVASSCRAWSGPPGTSEAAGRDQVVLVAVGGCGCPVKKL